MAADRANLGLTLSRRVRRGPFFVTNDTAVRVTKMTSSRAAAWIMYDRVVEPRGLLTSVTHSVAGGY